MAAPSPRFPVGTLVRVKGTFTDASTPPVPQDPSTVNLRWMDPAGNVTTALASAAPIVHDGTGLFHADLDTTLSGNTGGPGVWKYRWWATGTGQAAVDAEFIVDDSPLK